MVTASHAEAGRRAGAINHTSSPAETMVSGTNNVYLDS